MRPVSTQDNSCDSGSTNEASFLQSTTVSFLPLVIPANQFDWFLLTASGLAVLIIVILLIIIVILLFVMRRRTNASKAQAIDSLADDQVITRESEAAPPAIATQDEDSIVTQPSLPRADQPQTRPTSGQRPSQINWKIAGLSDVGRKRELNEDQMLMVETELTNGEPGGLYVIADGMGGHERGEIASQLTVKTIQTCFDQAQPATPPYEDWLDDVVRAANETVISHQPDKHNDKKMGSTLVMALVTGSQAHIANVGDSRAYHLSNDSIEQISVDHSLVERLVQIGQITREEARTHKQRNVIYSTIGDKSKLQIGLYHIDLHSGDRLLLCSDGLSDMLTDEQLLNINRSYVSPVEACDALIKAANAAGGEDNITAILIEIDSEEMIESEIAD